MVRWLERLEAIIRSRSKGIIHKTCQIDLFQEPEHIFPRSKRPTVRSEKSVHNWLLYYTS